MTTHAVTTGLCVQRDATKSLQKIVAWLVRTKHCSLVGRACTPAIGSKSRMYVTPVFLAGPATKFLKLTPCPNCCSSCLCYSSRCRTQPSRHNCCNSCKGFRHMLLLKAIGVELPQQLLAIAITKTQSCAKGCSALHTPRLQTCFSQ